MEVIIPQYVVSDAATTANKVNKAVLLQMDFNTTTEPDPTPIWSAMTEYSTESDPVYYLETEGPSEGCFVKYSAIQDMLGTDVGKNPYTSIGYWSNLGTHNKYGMFDRYNQTQTTDSDVITVWIKCSSISTLSFINIQAETITYSLWNETSIAACTVDPVFTGELGGTDDNTDAIIFNLYQYFFNDFEYSNDMSTMITLPMYNETILKIVFTPWSGRSCKVGTLLLGRSYYIGALQYGVTTGIEDYSKKTFNETFGNYYLKEGPYRKTMECDLLIKNTDLNEINNILIQLRATLATWQGNTGDMQFDNLLIYGFMSYFKIVMSYPQYSKCSLEIEGII